MFYQEVKQIERPPTSAFTLCARKIRGTEGLRRQGREQRTTERTMRVHSCGKVEWMSKVYTGAKENHGTPRAADIAPCFAVREQVAHTVCAFRVNRCAVTRAYWHQQNPSRECHEQQPRCSLRYRH